MNFRAIIAIILCRTLRFISRALHRGGTAMPGRWALKVCPELLSIVSRGVQVVAVTGTNGKTTVSRMIEEAFAAAGKSCFSNRSGANLISGITTEFVMNSTLSGRCRKDHAVIECDEAASKRVFAQMQPRVIVVTNLFRDQLDRYGEVTTTLENIRVGISGAPDALLCLNADCSLTSSLADVLPNKVVYFGIDKGATLSGEIPEISDATHCIRCKRAYEYDFISYGHLGSFRCPVCGYRRQNAQYAVTDITSQGMDSSTVVMDIKGERRIVNINLPAMYNIYNAASAAAAICEMGLGADTAVQALEGFRCGFGRMEKFPLGKAGTRMMLVKNPVGCNQVIDFLGNVKEPFSLVICLNDRSADGTDISWIWDADFEKLAGQAGYLTKIVISGDRAAEMALRIKYAGIDPGHISIVRSYEDVVTWAQGESEPVLIMPNYTAMLELRETVVRRIGGESFWE